MMTQVKDTVKKSKRVMKRKYNEDSIRNFASLKDQFEQAILTAQKAIQCLNDEELMRLRERRLAALELPEDPTIDGSLLPPPDSARDRMAAAAITVRNPARRVAPSCSSSPPAMWTSAD